MTVTRERGELTREAIAAIDSSDLLQDILGRPADSGSQGFLTQLNSGVSLTVIATTLVGSTVYVRDRKDILALDLSH